MGLEYFENKGACGLFNIEHLISIICFIALLLFFLFLSRKMTDKGFKICHIVVAIAVTVAEIIKVTLKVSAGRGPDDWLPLYYCSLFIFAIWLSLLKNKTLSAVGYSYITMGGILAGTLFTLYPSTSLGMYPFFHPSCFHSFFYHLTMVYFGILLIWKKKYQPNPKHFIHYLSFILIACVPSYFFNEWLGSNCMFLHNAFGLPILNDVLQFSHPLYMIVIIIAQTFGIYWVSYGIYSLIRRKI